MRGVLRQLSASFKKGFDWKIGQVGISVAALMTASLIKRRVKPQKDIKRVIIPGRAKADLAQLASHFQAEVEKGPDEVSDLPEFFGKKRKRLPLARRGTLLFAEIVDAPYLSPTQIFRRAERLKGQGADVIDLGCLPETPFTHLEEAVRGLKKRGFRVSADSTDDEELLRADAAGADYLLSFHEQNLDAALRARAIPVLIPNPPGDMESLGRAIERFAAARRPFFADAILDPVHYGFSRSVGRYLWLVDNYKNKYKNMEIFMGTGNVTELLDADSSGVTMLTMGIASELGVKGALVVSVSPHCRRAVAEADKAWRILSAAKKAESLACGVDSSLLALHDKRPNHLPPSVLKQMAKRVKDPNFRIFVGEDGVYLFNKEKLGKSDEPFALFPQIRQTMQVKGDIGHAFYLGVELARAEIAYKLGKRYVQDEELDWGVASPFAKKPPAWAKTTRRQLK